MSAPWDVDFRRLLEDARTTTAAYFTEHGVEPTLTVGYQTVELTEDGNGWHSGHSQLSENVLATQRPYLHTILRSAEWVEAARVLANQLREEFPEPPPEVPLLMGTGFASVYDDLQLPTDDKSRYLAEFVILPTWHYLTTIPSVEQGDDDLAREIVEQLEQLLTTRRFRLGSMIPLLCSATTGTLATGRSRLRRLTPEERGRFLEPPTQRFGSVGLEFGPIRSFDVPSHVLESEEPCDDPTFVAPMGPPDLLVALFLQGHNLSGPGWQMRRLLPQWYPTGFGHTPLALHSFPRGGQPTISATDFSRAVRTAEQLAPHDLADPRRPTEIAIKRFLMGCTRDDAADALVDFVVALEALLLRGSSYTELRYRFRLHGAHFIASHPVERQGLFDQLKDVYDARSSLVHGGTPPRSVGQAMDQARSLARRGLLKAIESRFPDDVYFERILLGQESL